MIHQMIETIEARGQVFVKRVVAGAGGNADADGAAAAEVRRRQLAMTFMQGSISPGSYDHQSSTSSSARERMMPLPGRLRHSGKPTAWNPSASTVAMCWPSRQQ